MTKADRLKALSRTIERLESRLIPLEQRSLRYSWLRLVVFFGGIGISAIFFFLGYLQVFAAGLVATAAGFGAAAAMHRRLDRAIARHKMWIRIKRRHIARAKLDWSELPAAKKMPASALELDLDLTGDFSLHRLIDSASTADGSQRLVDWLATATPEPKETMRRQMLVRELVDLPLLRDRITLAALLTRNENKEWDSGRVLGWLDRPGLSRSISAWTVLLTALAVLNMLFLSLNLAGAAPAIWQITFLVYVALFLLRSRELGEPFHEAAGLRDGLEQFSAVFQELEAFRYQRTPRLEELCRPFTIAEGKPSYHMARVNRVVAATGIRSNPLFWLILNAIVPWDYIFAWRLDLLRIDLRELLPQWLDIWYDLEALGSLAAAAYLNPHYTFPEFISSDNHKDPVFEAKALGHPLIPDDHKVCNNFAINALGDIVIISGSNMSGKSTFLRTTGINLILGQAGGAVDAAFMRCRFMRLHTCIRISDSVTDGISYFYAEVKCLKALLEALDSQHPLPLFYFVDEIFQGTNNRERRIGSRAYVQALAGKPGIGLLSTHDLDLVQISDEVSVVKNLHFRDDVADGKMVFSYLLHEGPSPTTNALRIMRQEGLPV